jgi:hypothetical protein
MKIIQKITFRKFCSFLNWYKLKKREKKTKSFWAWRNGDQETGGSERCRIQSQEEDQELGRSVAAPTLISQTSGVTQSVDLTNQGLGNHYLRDVQDVFGLQFEPEDSISDMYSW